jgi:hypothetical protein
VERKVTLLFLLIRLNKKSMERKMMRNRHLRESENRIKELKAQEPLFCKIESKFKQEFEIPELEKRKKVLDELRNLPYHTKTDIDDIRNHSVEYQKLRKKRLEERIKDRMDNIKSFSNYSVNKYKTKTFEVMAMRDEMQNSMEEEKRQERIKLLQSKNHYAKNVLDLHKPTISKRKQEEMKRIIEEINKPPNLKVGKIKYERSDDSILNYPLNRSMGGRMSQARNENGRDPESMSRISKFDDSIESPTGVHKQDLKDSDFSEKKDGLETVPEKVAKFESALNPNNYYHNNRSKTTIRGGSNRHPPNLMAMSIDSYQPKPFIKFDYLAELRNKKIEQDAYDYKEKEFWREEIENPNKSAIDKYMGIKLKAEELERKAKLKETHMGGSGRAIKESDEVSKMYMDAIRAKAALLENL